MVTGLFTPHMEVELSLLGGLIELKPKELG